MISYSLETLSSPRISCCVSGYVASLCIPWLVYRTDLGDSCEPGTVPSSRGSSKALQKHPGDSLRQSFGGKHGDVQQVRAGGGGVLPAGRGWSTTDVAPAEQQVQKFAGSWFLGGM